MAANDLRRLQVSFRHFVDAELPGLGGINILVGPNNAGKTSLFRGVAAYAQLFQQPARDRATRAPLAGHKIGLCFELDGAEFGLEKLGEQAEVSYSVTGNGGRDTNVSLMIGGQKCLLFMKRGDAMRPSGVARRKPEEEGAELARSRANPLGDSWLQNSYFLWHRRKSKIEEVQGAADHSRLDAEAEHLAGRLDAVRSGDGGLDLGRQLDGFINSVIPGVGTVHVARRFVKEDDSGGSGQTLIYVRFKNSDGQALGLDSLGGGVEQVLAIALVLLAEAASDHRSDQSPGALFVEEPETHLHQLAQRRLVEQIEKHRRGRQIFIATHSPVFMNSFRDAQIYRVTRDAKGQGIVKKCVDLHDHRETLNELGVLPSTLLQTNIVVWVEGPSDSRLIEHWLSLLAPDLKLHVDYEFAETGGSNLSGYGADLLPDETAKLHDILRICRNNFLVADRDGPPDAQAHKDAVKSVADLFGDNVWVTGGYEIEWYFPNEGVLARWKVSLADAPPDRPFYSALAETGQPGTKTAKDRKVAHAAWMVAHDYGDKWFAGGMGKELRESVERLAKAIRAANGVAPEDAPSVCPECHRPTHRE